MASAQSCGEQEERRMTLQSRAEIIYLVREITDCSDKSEAEIDRLIDRLEKGVLDPQITDYLFWNEMTPEEIADTALAYTPMCL